LLRPPVRSLLRRAESVVHVLVAKLTVRHGIEARPALADAPVAVEIDPDGWILKTAVQVVLADADADGVPDAVDCAPADPVNEPVTAQVTGLEVDGGPVAGLQWDPAPGQALGVVYDLLTGEVSGMLAGAGTQNAVCSATGIPLPETTDVQIPGVGDALYYMIRARNACGPGPLGPGSEGARVANACP